MILVRLSALAIWIVLLAPFNGKVVGVIDGDTIDVLKDGKAVRVRLNGIDCPEKAQAFGSKAKQFTADMVFGKSVKVVEKEIDRYGRTIADIYFDNGTWLNKCLIDSGYAWHYKRYSNNEELAAAEVRARKVKAGLWKDNPPMAPWDYRNR